MSQHAWYQHFKEQLQGLTESYEQSGSSISLLRYALQEKRLQPEEYLKWAQTHYLLPLLQSRFFTETPVSQEMFAKWATHYPWSEECLPVAEWDGSLIVACLQPPQDFPQNPTAILVLATTEDLQTAWKHLHPEKSEKAQIPEAAPSEAPEGMDLFGLELGESASEAPSEEMSENAEGEAVEVEEEKLDGIFDGATVVQLRPLSGQPEVSAEAPPVEASPIEVSPEIASPVEPVPAADSTLEKTVVASTPRPAPLSKPSMNPVTAGHYALEKIKTKNSSLVDTKVQQALHEMKAHFQKSLILTLDEQGSQLKAFAWDENFKGMKDTTVSVPLRTPSIFNIVYATQKPFHGYISLNEINEKFFEDWNQGQVPDHVTITPLLINDNIVGLLMGFAEKSAYNKISLGFAEKVSKELTQALQAA